MAKAMDDVAGGIGMIGKAEFIGVCQTRDSHLVMSIRQAFSGVFFDLCTIHSLESFDYDTFATWVRKYHCKHFKSIPAAEIEMLKLYVVNYLMCPDATCELEVRIAMEHVWPSPPPPPKIVLWLRKLMWWRKAE